MPAIVWCTLRGNLSGALVLLVAACVSDFFDGYIARRFNQTSVFGQLLDPVADKVLIVGLFAVVACTAVLPFSIPPWFFGFVIIKEIAFMGGGAYLYRVYGAEAIRPVYVSKITTTVQMIFLIWLFVCALAGWHPQKTYYVFVAVMVLLMGMRSE